MKPQLIPLLIVSLVITANQSYGQFGNFLKDAANQAKKQLESQKPAPQKPPEPQPPAPAQTEPKKQSPDAHPSNQSKSEAQETPAVPSQSQAAPSLLPEERIKDFYKITSVKFNWDGSATYHIYASVDSSIKDKYIYINLDSGSSTNTNISFADSAKSSEDGYQPLELKANKTWRLASGATYGITVALDNGISIFHPAVNGRSVIKDSGPTEAALKEWIASVRITEAHRAFTSPPLQSDPPALDLSGTRGSRYIIESKSNELDAIASYAVFASMSSSRPVQVINKNSVNLRVASVAGGSYVIQANGKKFELHRFPDADPIAHYRQKNLTTIQASSADHFPNLTIPRQQASSGLQFGLSIAECDEIMRTAGNRLEDVYDLAIDPSQADEYYTKLTGYLARFSVNKDKLPYLIPNNHESRRGMYLTRYINDRTKSYIILLFLGNKLGAIHITEPDINWLNMEENWPFVTSLSNKMGQGTINALIAPESKKGLDNVIIGTYTMTWLADIGCVAYGRFIAIASPDEKASTTQKISRAAQRGKRFNDETGVFTSQGSLVELLSLICNEPHQGGAITNRVYWSRNIEGTIKALVTNESTQRAQADVDAKKRKADETKAAADARL